MKINLLFTNTFCIVFLFSSCLAHADIVYLKNGQKIEGEVIKEDNGFIQIRVKMGEAKINRADVENIERKDLPEGFFEEEVGPAKEGENNNVKGEIEEKGENETNVAEKIVYEINVEAKFIKENNKGIVEVNGRTNFPDNTLIYVFLRRQNITIASLELSVNGNTFMGCFDRFHKELPLGEYVVDAVFMYGVQPENIKNLLNNLETKSISGSYAVLTGTEEEVKEKEKEDKEKVSSIVTELENLYNELNAECGINFNNFNAEEWDNWSNNWLLRMKELNEKVSKIIDEGFVSLNPNIISSVLNVITSIFSLYDIYSVMFKDPKIYSEIYSTPNTLMNIGSIDMLNKQIFNKIDYIRKNLPFSNEENKNSTS